jgi:hypothetical protein
MPRGEENEQKPRNNRLVILRKKIRFTVRHFLFVADGGCRSTTARGNAKYFLPFPAPLPMNLSFSSVVISLLFYQLAFYPLFLPFFFSTLWVSATQKAPLTKIFCLFLLALPSLVEKIRHLQPNTIRFENTKKGPSNPSPKGRSFPCV